MKKTARSCEIMQRLLDNPNKDFNLSAFAAEFECAKSSISEDIKLVKSVVEENGSGYIKTTAGVKGGVSFVPAISNQKAEAILSEAKLAFESKERILGNGFLYTSDLMFNPEFAKNVARVFVKIFAGKNADVVVTVETKGISIATFTAELLGLPLVVIRRESKVTDGSTLSINYFSGSSDRIQKMSLSKRALKPGSKAIILDDFMRGGGSIKGILDMLAEFDCSAVGTGVVIATDDERKHKLGDVYPLLIAEAERFEQGECKLHINRDIFN